MRMKAYLTSTIAPLHLVFRGIVLLNLEVAKSHRDFMWLKAIYINAHHNIVVVNSSDWIVRGVILLCATATKILVFLSHPPTPGQSLSPSQTTLTTIYLLRCGFSNLPLPMQGFSASMPSLVSCPLLQWWLGSKNGVINFINKPCWNLRCFQALSLCSRYDEYVERKAGLNL